MMTLTSLALLVQTLAAQPSPYSAPALQTNLLKLMGTGSLLHIAAHPDDENTLLLAYFSRHRNLRTGYLSLTRGEGGQNLIGPEQGVGMGLIRTQELIAARKVDAAEQFFTRAIDFGFTKTPVEALEKWGQRDVLGDVVFAIRQFRPDVIVLRFTGTPADGHGQHQASALLAKEAFFAAADPTRFHEQLQYVHPFQARRLYQNLFSFTPQLAAQSAKTPGRIPIEAGEYNALLGLSYGEIEGLSRSLHASQAMGWRQLRGARTEYFLLLAGEPAIKDPFEGVDTTWHRFEGGAAVATALSDALATFRPAEPERMLPALLKARRAIQAINHPAARRRLPELDELLVHAVGLWLDASATAPQVVPGAKLSINAQLSLRRPAAVTFHGLEIQGATPTTAGAKGTALTTNQPLPLSVAVPIPADMPFTQPYWLQLPRVGERYTLRDQTLLTRPENEPALRAVFHLEIAGEAFSITRPVEQRYVDPGRGELTRPLVVVPPVAVEFSDASVLFPNRTARAVQVTVKANEKAAGRLRLDLPAGWQANPPARDYSLDSAGQQTTLSFEITPPAADTTATVTAICEQNGRQYSQSMKVIQYPHIPPQTVFAPATARLVRTEIRVLSQKIGYIMGAGDLIPDALRQLGLQVTLLSDDDLAVRDLAAFDTIIAGIRVFNTRPAVRANFQRLLDFANNGGTLVVQYNTATPAFRQEDNVLARIGPYPMTIDSSRVTVEDSPVRLGDHPLMNAPNALSPRDFEGWVQERGLYFAKSFDPRYTSLFASHDPNEDWLPGGTLFARHGKGAYVFTAYSWFRQLPAGVPGAFRIFANLISAAKVQ